MSDLSDLAQAAQSSSKRSRGTLAYTTQGRHDDNLILKGFLLALGAAPVLLLTLIISHYIEMKMTEAEVRSTILRAIEQQSQELFPPTPHR